MRLVGLISGGKDSIYNMLQCIAAGHEIVAVANIEPDRKEELDSYMYQSVGHQVISFIGGALALPIFRQKTKGKAVCKSKTYVETSNDEVEDLFLLLNKVKKEMHIEGVSVGAIASDYQRTRVENVCERLNLKCFAFLWKRNQEELLQEMIDSQVDAVVIKVASIGLNPDIHLGMHIKDIKDHLFDLNKKFGVSVCGEGGEYETLTLDCPLFHRLINITEFENVIISNDAFAPVGFLNVKKATLQGKIWESDDPVQSLQSRLDHIKSLVKNPYYYIQDCIDEISLNIFPQQQKKSATEALPFPFESETQRNSEDRSSVLEYWKKPSFQKPHSSQKVSFSPSSSLSLDTTNSNLNYSSGWCCLGNLSSSTLPEALTCLQKHLERCKYEFSDLVFVNIFIRDITDFNTFNKIYSQFMPERHPPARACVATQLPADTAITIMAVAHKLVSKSQKMLYGNFTPDRDTLHVQSISHWAPANIGPYSQCVKVGDFYYVAGQIPLIPGTMEILNKPIIHQCRLALRHILRILEAMNNNLNFSNILLAICYVTSEEIASDILPLWSYITNNQNAVVSAVVVTGLPKNAQLEWEVFAGNFKNLEVLEEVRKIEEYSIYLKRCVVIEPFASTVICNVTFSSKFSKSQKNLKLITQDGIHLVLKYTLQFLRTDINNVGTPLCMLKLFFKANEPSLASVISDIVKSCSDYKVVATGIPVITCQEPDAIITITGVDESLGIVFKMVHIPSPYAFDFWLREPSSNQVELSCLMPNGIFIPLPANRNAILLEIKEELWEEASKYPLHGILRDASSYIFSCISTMGETEELRDENRRLCDVRPFCSVLKLIEKKKGDYDGDERAINFQISSLIGKGLHEFEGLKNPEVNDFRWKMKLLGTEVAKNRQNKSWLEKVAYQFPPRLASSSTIPQNCLSRMREGSYFVVDSRFQNTETAFKFNVSYSTTPMQLLQLIMNKKSITLNTKGEHPGEFMLKVCGQEEYLIGDYPLVRFLYIQECLSRDVTPTVVVISVNSVQVDQDIVYENLDDFDLSTPRQSFSTLTLRKNKGKYVSSWIIDDIFSFKVCAITRLNTDVNRPVEVGIQAGIFHGGKPLCESQKTSEKMVSRDGCVDFEEDLQFDIQISNIPRMARICFAIYEISKNAKGVKARKLKDSKQDLYMNPLAWVNTTVYDFKNQLKTGDITLYMWTYAEDSQYEDMLQSLGTVVSNTNVDHATALTLSFKRYSSEHTIMYPSVEKMIEHAEKFFDPSSVVNRSSQDVRSYLENVRQLSESDPLHDMHEQDLKELWALRYEALKYVPSLLPKLLDTVEWNNRNEVAEAISLLQKWPRLPVEKALELLDYAYADQQVRSFAVKCLQTVSDEELSLFLLQLVQALKHESYLSCDLVEFLLRRALNNRKIGHFLFWHLKSEMTVPSVSVRFGLILEAYCRGSQKHMDLLAKQLEYLNKMKETSELIRQRKDRDKARQWLHERLSESHCAEILSDVVNPLDPRYKMKRVRIEKCRVMDSKMRPLYMVMENDDPYGEDVYIIFKNGDDLRQDMLALQMIKIMDMLWKNEGLDLRMNPYGCVSTEHRVGLIEVVLNAETIANIQKEKGMFSATSAFSKGSLLAWLKDYNPEENQLLKAIEEFTLSCAGYCVATYVLGVADRHSDNIMVKKSGQLFHIDFGHILGHFKEKFGFRRERVPFVLTHDFVHVINKGQKDKKEALEFQIFQNHCEKAFLILRRHGSLILSLFAMMISTGLPELSSEKDLNYLRETLVLDLSENEALSHFRSKFCEALANSWKTSLNWASHNLAKNNKQ